MGGSLENYHVPAGDNANCVIEEWKLWQEMNAPHLIRPYQPNNGGANPASVNCEDLGGTLRIITSPIDESGCGVVEQWTLFRAINAVRKP